MVVWGRDSKDGGQLISRAGVGQSIGKDGGQLNKANSSSRSSVQLLIKYVYPIMFLLACNLDICKGNPNPHQLDCRKCKGYTLKGVRVN